VEWLALGLQRTRWAELTMAKYSYQRSPAAEHMKSPGTLLARTSAMTGRSSFIVLCDDTTLRWLSESLRNLGNRTTFRLGDDLPIGSDDKCSIEVAPGAAESLTAIAPSASACFRWVLPAKQAKRYADLIDGMADRSGACHQYLEEDKPGLPVVLVTKGEYDVETLRQMREAHP
jgi:hypothetical protein